MRPIVYVVGARPNFVKMAPVIERLTAALPGTRHVVVHTEQHYDHEMSQVFLDELGLGEPDHVLGVGSGSHGAQTGRVLERIERLLEAEIPQAMIVAGDVNSTLAAALAGAKLDIPIAHVEAGLRSFDRTMPEEINRVLTDQISRWCFTHSPEAEQNLIREGVPKSRIHLVGNTMIDTLVRLRGRFDLSDIHERLGVERGRYLLVTLHRPHLVDGPLLGPVIDSLRRLSSAMPVVFPMHPRTRAHLCDVEPIAGRFLLIAPLSYVDFMAMEVHAAAALTDSGGVQEETTFLRVPCFTLRATTERPVTITQGTNHLLGLDPSAIAAIPERLNTSPRPSAPPAWWDGQASDRIASVLGAELRDAWMASPAAD